MEGQGYWTNMVEGNDDLSFDDFSSPPEEQESPVINSTPSARPNQKRSKNFSEQEDQLLVSAWLNISTDPIQGTNQTKGSFWTRVYDYYHSNKEFTSDRSQSSLLHRWKGILENVNKFCGCVTRIEGRNQSGVTYQDKVVHLYFWLSILYTHAFRAVLTIFILSHLCSLYRQWLCSSLKTRRTSRFNSFIAGINNYSSKKNIPPYMIGLTASPQGGNRYGRSLCIMKLINKRTEQLAIIGR